MKGKNSIITAWCKITFRWPFQPSAVDRIQRFTSEIPAGRPLVVGYSHTHAICSRALWLWVFGGFFKCWHHCDVTQFLCKRLLGLMIICQGLPFQRDYLKDMKESLWEKAWDHFCCFILTFTRLLDLCPSSRRRLTSEPKMILLRPHLHLAFVCTLASSSPLSSGSLAAFLLAPLAHRVLSLLWEGWTKERIDRSQRNALF